MNENQEITVGHNKPPIEPPEKGAMKDQIKQRHADLFKRFAEVMAALRSAPAAVGDDETSGKVGDILKAVRAWLAQAVATRKVENEEWRRVVAEVNTAFNIPIEEMEKVRDEVKARNDRFLTEKAERQRVEFEERARAERLEADRRAQEAAAAEGRRIEAERKAREAQEREDRARRDREEQERLAAEAKARAERAKAEEERIARERRERIERERTEATGFIADLKRQIVDAERLSSLAELGTLSEDGFGDLEAVIGNGGTAERQIVRIVRLGEDVLTKPMVDAMELLKFRFEQLRETATARKRAADDARTAQLAAERERARKIEEEQAAERQRIRAEEERLANEARQRRIAEEQALAQAKEQAKVFRAEEKAAGSDGRGATREAKSAGREERAAFAEAEKGEGRANKLDDKAEDDSAMARTRGDLGSVGTLARRWVYRVTDRELVKRNLGLLGPFLHVDAVDTAIQKYMDAGNRVLPGVVFEHIAEGKII